MLPNKQILTVHSMVADLLGEVVGTANSQAQSCDLGNYRFIAQIPIKWSLRTDLSVLETISVMKHITKYSVRI